MELLVAQHVGYRIDGRWLVQDVSLSLSAGEVVALVGPNGAGKSTLLSLLAGDWPPTTGTIRLEGQELGRLSATAQARRRAVLRQQVVVTFPFTALEVVLMGRAPHLRGQREGEHDLAIARDAMAQTETATFALRSLPTLSGGEQARVQLARVLAQTTPVLLLDEPTAALDLRHQHRVLHLARQAAAQGGAALIVLHDVNLAALYADRIGVMHQGRLCAIGRPWDVLQATLLSDVYGVPIKVQQHPHTAAPLVLSLPEHSTGSSVTYGIEVH
ncbi:heme ABC transporter ATP-binding protein [Chloroflexus aggregans]|uniref:ABC transporter related n=1 Tax=Chloroflexus aggregans (strain MD-66 / DSM 9485) TaxID=326427 RepID=B8G8A2_CHLAD|nr:heme ABC transporter ATP-binding protein [Chloroflexus aggregans]ACL26156.1 ABC transporter related [Chloroflexus aggregans DSM 9485]